MLTHDNKVQMKANILCAGKGERFRPFSFIKPKSLFEVGGIPLIERIIIQLQEEGVQDIALVTGYKSEEFEYLKAKYNVSLYKSTEYETKNNFSSLLLVKHRLDNSLIIDSDICLDKKVLPLIQGGKSQFVCQKFDAGDSWALEYNENLQITAVKKGASAGYLMSGLSYWVGEGAALLAKELENCKDDEFWEDAAIRVMAQTPVYISKAPHFADEIDSLHDALCAKLVTRDEIAMQCNERGIVERLKSLTNNTYKVILNNEEMVLRIPGEGTEKIIDRSYEEYIMKLVEHLDITPRATYYAGGIKTLAYLKNFRILEAPTLTKEEVMGVANTMHKLHSIVHISDVHEYPPFSMQKEMLLYEGLARIEVLDKDEKDLIHTFARQLDEDKPVLCHRDFVPENVMTDGKEIKLIDFEYACFTSPYWDIASFITETRMDTHLKEALLDTYGKLDAQRVLQAEIFVDYIWGLWGFYRGCYGYGRKRIAYMDAHLELYRELYSHKD